jgi:predicted Zn-dependent protease
MDNTITETRPMSVFCTTKDGYTMRFNNGLVISVQWTEGSLKVMNGSQSKKAGISIWDGDGKNFVFFNSYMQDDLDTNEVAEWIALVSTADDLKHLYRIALAKYRVLLFA